MLDITTKYGDTRGMTYPGGKNAAGTYQRIINLIPEHSLYCEPFLGSGAILRLKSPAQSTIGIESDADVIEEHWLAEPHPIYSNDVRIDIAGQTRTQLLPLDLSLVSQPGLNIVHGDGIQFLETFNFPKDSFVYCDPPYHPETTKGRPPYNHILSKELHERLLRALSKLPCKAMISGYWHEFYAWALQDWHHLSFKAMTRGGLAREHLWYNYDPPSPKEQHDLKHVGKDYREREQIKKMVDRWEKNFTKMPPARRRLVLAALLKVDLGLS